MIFKGFEFPEQNYSKLPHEFIDLLPQIDSLAELKVILYILRHTWGFSEFDKPKKMTLDELQNGRKRRDGSRMDGGTGLSVNSIKAGVEKAAERGILKIETDESDRARIEKWYSLNMSDESNFDSRLSKVDSLPSKVDNRTEKETIERKELRTDEEKAKYLPLDWQIAAGVPIQPLDEFDTNAKDLSNSLDFQCQGAGSLGYAFMTTRRLLIPASRIKGNKKAAREMLEMGVKPEHVIEATRQLVEKGMTVTDLFSISKTAIDIANKPQKEVEKVKLL